MTKSSATLAAGTILNDRYKIIAELGRGGFGRTYLAEDVYRYSEKCVLKEFAPEVGDDRQLRKATELFNREAGILYKLNHDRIPTFHALIRSSIEGKECLFLAQQYIEGETYLKLLNQGKVFNEAEVTQLILDVIEILEYIHNLNLIHRDISPDNLIRRRSDNKPVLIDFGCVKEAASVATRNQRNYLATAIGKRGYAPDEQLRMGQVFFNSDIYALAVTAIVLLTGKEPEELYNSHNAAWHWKREVRVSENLERTLDKMLAHLPNDRFLSTREVRQALQDGSRQNISQNNSMLSRIRTMAFSRSNAGENNSSYQNYSHSQPQSSSPTYEPNNQQSPNTIWTNINNAMSRVATLVVASPLGNIGRRNQQNQPQHQSSHPDLNSPNPTNPRQNTFVRNWQKLALLGTGALVVPALITYAFIRHSFLPEKSTEKEKVTTIDSGERDRQEKIKQRLQKLNIKQGTFYQQVDVIFYQRYPKLKGVKLTNSQAHQEYRDRWYKIAEELLDKKEGK